MILSQNRKVGGKKGMKEWKVRRKIKKIRKKSLKKLIKLQILKVYYKVIKECEEGKFYFKCGIREGTSEEISCRLRLKG